PGSARGSSQIELVRQRRSGRRKIGRSACVHRTLSQRGYYVDRSRCLSGRPTRNASRAKSSRSFHKSARLDFRHPGKGIVMHVVVVTYRPRPTRRVEFSETELPKSGSGKILK